jgi:competence protein ComEA
VTGQQQIVVLFLSFLAAFVFFLYQSFRRDCEAPLLPHGRFFATEEMNEPVLIELEGNAMRRGILAIPAGTSVSAALEKMGGIEEGLSLSPAQSSLPIKENSRLRIRAEEGKAQVVLEPLAASKMKVLGVPVSINTATVEQLSGLPGVGPQTARAILTHRERRGKFKSPDELLQVPGIGPKKLAHLRSHILIR